MKYNIPFNSKFSARRAALCLALAALLVGAVPYHLAAQSGGSYVITQAVLSGGGGASSSVNYQLAGTVGQSLADSGTSSGGVYDLASGFWNPQQNAPAGGLEGDVATRPAGNGVLSATDITQMRRFVAGLDTATFGSEFQRADSAPRASFGNGLIAATDITQTRRYVAALDAAANTNGPASPGARPQPAAPQRDAPTGGRIIRIASQFVVPPAQVVVPVEIDSQGDEVAVSFSVNYDPAALSINNDPTRIALGNGVPLGTTLTRNANTPGRLGIVLDAGAPFAAGTRRMVTITFDVLAALTVTNLGFGDVPTARDVSDDQAQSLPTTYEPGTVTITAPTLARMEKFAAYRSASGNLIEWQSSFETSNLGFLIYRQENGGRALLTPSPVAGSALFAGSRAVLTAGHSYAWRDAAGQADSVYWIEDIDLNGQRAWHGPVTIAECGWQSADSPNAPCGMRHGDFSIRSNSVLLNELAEQSGERGVILKAAPANLASGIENLASPSPGSDAWQQQLRLAAGPAVKIAVRQDGWQRVAAAQLFAAGLSANADARFLQLYADGRELPLLVSGNNGPLGANGFVEFYGTGLDTRETDTRIYWLIVGDRPGLRVGTPVRSAVSASGISHLESALPLSGISPSASELSPAQASFPHTIERKERAIYFAALNNGEDTENFFGPVVNPAGATQTLRVSHLDASATARLSVTLQGATDGPHAVRVTLNGQELGVAQYAGQENKTAQFTLPPNALAEGDNTVTLHALNGVADVSLIDTVKITYAHRYTAENNRLLLSTGTRNGLTINGFTTPNARVFDVTEPARVSQLAARVTPDAAGYAVHLHGQLRRRALLAVGDEAVATPAGVAANEPSDWTNSQRAADFLILTHRTLRGAAQPLATLRAAQGLATQIITLEDIYDEWSGGAQDVRAVSAFLRWARENWQSAPRYLLLLGDASLDPRGYLGVSADFVPTRYTGTQYLETSADELLADFDGDGVSEMAVGRLPVSTSEEAQAVIDKIVYYYQPGNQTGALLVADRPDGYDFAGLNQQIRALLPGDMPVTNVNRAAGTDAEARQQILSALNAGPSLVNYTGHGSAQVWTGAGLLRHTDATQLSNGNRLPLFVMMTCLNGYFHDPATESLAEALVKAPSGGAIAAWASSSLTVPQPQAQLDQEFIRLLYQPGPPPRLGDAVLQAKLSVSDGTLRRTWIFLGDPTLRLRE